MAGLLEICSTEQRQRRKARRGRATPIAFPWHSQDARHRGKEKHLFPSVVTVELCRAAGLKYTSTSQLRSGAFKCETEVPLGKSPFGPWFTEASQQHLLRVFLGLHLGSSTLLPFSLALLFSSFFQYWRSNVDIATVPALVSPVVKTLSAAH